MRSLLLSCAGLLITAAGFDSFKGAFKIAWINKEHHRCYHQPFELGDVHAPVYGEMHADTQAEDIVAKLPKP